MVFTSLDFLVFLALVFPLHWLVFSGRVRVQNLFLLAASYVFYGYWDVRFLALMVATTILDYAVSQKIATSQGRTRRLWLGLSLTANFGVLGFFKYYNFFLDSLGLTLPSWNILLPVGISFYTFQAVSYMVDVYRGREPARDLVEFLTFVAFFPHLVAGPIQRADELMVQFQKRRRLCPEVVSVGLRLMLWGFFKKLVVGDNCAPLVDKAFSDPSLEGMALGMGLLFFSFQIYADFSGYSDIAVGTAKLFGIHLGQNFHYPYFSRGFREFWQRWHISLSTWFRDYVYIPLGGNRHAVARNILVTFFLSGLWHGANWTFVWWGLLHGIFYILVPYRNRTSLTWRDLPSQIMTFGVVTWLWVFFRATSLSQALDYTVRIFHNGHSSVLDLGEMDLMLCAGVGIFLTVTVEWLCRNLGHPCDAFHRFATPIRHLAYLTLLCAIYLLGNLQAGYDFIYFQF